MNGLAAQIIAACLAALTMLSTGLVLGWASPSLPKLLASDSDIPLTSDQSSWVVTFSLLGSIFGPLIAMLVIDRIGRKWTLYLTMLPILVGWLIVGLARNYSGLCAGRFIGGLGGGGTYVVVPAYLGEIAEDRIRGGLGTLTSTMAALGTLMAYSVGPWVSRQMLAMIASIPPLIFIIAFFCMPETPYYHLMKGKRDAARLSLAWLRSTNDVQKELAQMEQSVGEQQQKKTDIFRLVSDPARRKAFLIVFGLFTFQQLCGIMAIQSYASEIFELSGASFSSSVSVIIMGVVKLASAICVVFIVDVTGRRPCLLISSIGMTLCMTLEGIYYHLQENGQDLSGVTWIPLVVMLCYFLAYSLGLGSLPFAILGEIFPTDVKALGSTMLIIYIAIMASVITKLYQVIVDAIGMHFAFYGFAIFSAIGVIYVYFCVPETKGRSLQDIQNELNSRTFLANGTSKDSD